MINGFGAIVYFVLRQRLRQKVVEDRRPDFVVGLGAPKRHLRSHTVGYLVFWYRRRGSHEEIRLCLVCNLETHLNRPNSLEDARARGAIQLRNNVRRDFFAGVTKHLAGVKALEVLKIPRGRS